MIDILLTIVIGLGPAIILHEYAHGWVAHRLGDPTAKLAGRLTLNPLKHIDPFGSLILPGMLFLLQYMGMAVVPFGYAKPVPVNFLALRNPKRDMMLVAAAGPAINITVALVLSQLLQLSLVPLLSDFFMIAILINLMLAFFNLIPIPPLDGSRIVMGLLPPDLAAAYARLERYGILIVFVLLYLGMFRWLFPIVLLVAMWMGVR